MTISQPDATDLTETQAGFARRLGVSRQRVNAMIKAGMPVQASGRLDVEAALAWIRRNVETRRGGANPPDDSSDRGDGIDLTEARRLKVLVDTEIARVFLAKGVGSVLDKAETTKAITAYFRLIRDKFLNYPNRYGAQVAAAAGADPRAVMAELDRTIRLQMAEIKTIRQPESEASH